MWLNKWNVLYISNVIVNTCLNSYEYNLNWRFPQSF